MQNEAPAGLSRQRPDRFAVPGETAAVAVAHRLDAAEKRIALVFETGEADAAREREALLGRIQYLNHLPAHPVPGESRHHAPDLLDIRQEIAD